MDVLGGLSAARMALDLAKDLREIDKSVDEATFKMKLADLMSALADTQIAFADAKTRISELEDKIETLTNGEPCPKCRAGKLSLTSSEPMHFYGADRFGVEEQLWECGEEGCDYSTLRKHDPHGILPKLAATR
ncbi:hypothetical protein [Roseovarius sp.]|uniref:hypothetical protein n=1 Tax=Roseovarius sp. TaxID=1486281 RepID=UPI003BAD7120